MRKRFSLVALSLSVAVSTIAGAAGAQPTPSLDLRDFHVPTDPAASLRLEPTSTPGHLEWNVGVWASYARRSVALQDDAENEVSVPLSDQFSLDYFAGVGIGNRLAIGLAIPTVAYQTGDEPADPAVTPVLPTTGIGDVAFTAKATLVPTADLGGFGLATIARVTAPTGDERSFLGEGAATGELRMLGELRLIALDLRATAGARVRGSKETYVGEEFGDDLPWAVGVTAKPQAFGWDDAGRWLVSLETRGRVSLTPSFASGAQSPIQIGASARYTVEEISAIAGVELPLNDAVGNPAVRGVLGIGWAPRFYDEDGDGIEDSRDECAELEEDKDGFQDADGCPDFDNDDDGVPDADDRCPAEQEDADDFMDDDGCIDADNDNDGIPDTEDSCPDEVGPATGSPAPGCPIVDQDGDGILDTQDQCAAQPEDKDGFADTDGCPDPDNDGDKVLDDVDACPKVKGEPRTDPELNGCPNPDTDGDTYDDAVDKCPRKAEDFDGVDDTDGCPDDDSKEPAWKRAKPLVTLEQGKTGWTVKWRVAPKFDGKGTSTDLDPATDPSVRALAAELNKHPEFIVAIGVKPKDAESVSEQDALNRSFALVHALRRYTHRDDVAESVSWNAVSKLAGAGRAGLGILVLAPKPASEEPATIVK